MTGPQQGETLASSCGLSARSRSQGQRKSPEGWTVPSGPDAMAAGAADCEDVHAHPITATGTTARPPPSSTVRRPVSTGAAMSAALIAAVERTTLRPTVKAVLRAMVGPTKSHRPECWAALATIASKAHVSERTVRRLLRWLEDSGFITLTREARHHTTRHYQINPGAIAGAWEPRRRNSPGAISGAISKQPRGYFRENDLSPLPEQSGGTNWPPTTKAVTTTRSRVKGSEELEATPSAIAREIAPELRPPAALPGNRQPREPEPIEAENTLGQVAS